MAVHLTQMALMRFLERNDASYYGKIFEVRDEVGGWLSYIPHTFPHYTRHTIAHSEEIVSQLSQLLFEDGDISRSALPQLSATEAFILIVAAFLHDAGMVASDEEKTRILGTAEWHDWTNSGGGASRWRDIARLRDHVAEPAVYNFIADIQVRYLLAEFIRKRHHLRSGEFIRQHQEHLGRFAFSDRVLAETVASVCVAHGLNSHELADPRRFPDRRDIRGDKVNVRLMAILLRLGDLLDISSDRACPLLLNAACPLPPESLAHWTQYQRITHRMTAPDSIEIHAECNTQDEHRYLHDWCRWLVSEAHEAVFILRSSKRHAWVPPRVALDQPDATIRIEPSSVANYIPRNWTFELDQAAVFHRLIYDAYDVPHIFVRELLQNSADASRCRLYDDLRSSGEFLPSSPTDVPDSVRNQYPIIVTSELSDQPNLLSGETESVQTLSITDNGIGMDVDTIQRYFLQVGRSFYRTDAFKRDYGFAAASRFGIGFLSVFAEADEVEVNTFRAASLDGPLRLRLVGPRSYFTVERGTLTKPGTCIRLKLKTPIPNEVLIRAIRHWCKTLEFPVAVSVPGQAPVMVTAERPEDFISDVPDLSTEGGRFVVRAFPILEPGVRGHIYVESAMRSDGSESWRSTRDSLAYMDRFPAADGISIPPSMQALHGMNLADDWRDKYGFIGGVWSVRIDDRSQDASFTVARSSHRDPRFTPVVQRALRRLVVDHVAAIAPTDDESWKYLQQLMTGFGLEHLKTVPGSVPISEKGCRRLVSVEELLSFPAIATVLKRSRVNSSDAAVVSPPDAAISFLMNETTPILEESVYRGLSDQLRHELSKMRSIDKVQTRGDLVLARWIPGHANRLDDEGPSRPGQLNFDVFVAEIVDGPPIVACWINTFAERLVVSEAHPLGHWLQTVRDICRHQPTALTRRFMRDLTGTLMRASQARSHWKDFVEYWKYVPGLDTSLIPPPVDVEQISTLLYGDWSERRGQDLFEYFW